jgi:ubiquitin-conjugating enzyme E2 variant
MAHARSLLRCIALVVVCASALASTSARIARARGPTLAPRARAAFAARARATLSDQQPKAGNSLRPKPELTIPGDTLETLPIHRAYTLACSAAVVGLIVRAALVAPLPTAAATVLALLLGDLMSALIHWATDNYGDLRTPVVGTMCAAFQGHHKAPWTITHRSFANNVFKIAKTALPPIALAAAMLPPVGAAFVASLLYSQLLAQEFHRWSHCLPAELAPWQLRLQQSGLILSRRAHLAHHLAPFDAHYAILLGVANPIALFRWLEARIYEANGVEANCWREVKGGADVRVLALGGGAAR